MAAFIEEFAQWLGINVSGLDYWNASTQAGNLFINHLPDRAGTICAVFENSTSESPVPRVYRGEFEFRAAGANAETLAWAAHSWIERRSGSVTIPAPFNLTSWRVHEIDVSGQYPVKTGANESGKPTWSFRMSITRDER